jgi:hypothetical protein
MSITKPKAPLRATLAGPAPPDPNLPDPDPDLEELDDDLDPDTVIFSFLEAFPDPTDHQVHRLASLLGYADYGDFEEKIFELFGEEVQDGELDDLEDDDEDLDNDSEIDVEDDDDDEVDDDPVGTFLISFFLINNQPSEEQIHHLAEILGVTPEEIEEKIYSMLTNLVEDPDSDAADQVDDDLVDELEGDEEL